MRNGKWIVFLGLLFLAAAFRIAVAHWLPNDTPDDGRVYAQIARNILEQHVYSHEAQAPYDSSLIRLPGYPLFLAGIYSIFGHTNNGAVRVVQALIDTATCGLIALLAFYWQPDETKKRASAIAALALAAVCPFTAIYAATILTEVPTNFLVIAMFVAATLALRKTFTTEDTEKTKKESLKGVLWWCFAGLLGGLAVLMRPDNGLFLAAVGAMLVLTTIWNAVASAARHRFGSVIEVSQRETNPKRRRRFALPTHSKKIAARVLTSGSVFSLAFILVLVPWTIRNWRVFHLFQPLAPAHGEMPGEFVPRGYLLWLRTWIDDSSYTAPFLYALDADQIDVEDVPPTAFDSREEKQRVATLLEAYNNPPDTEDNATEQSQEEAGNSSDQPDESSPEQPDPGEMTPEIDAGFAQVAREHISRHRFQFYVLLPLKRARTMWFDTHSQYWPFEGALLPLEDLDYEHHQQIWLPLFAGLTAVYTLLGLAGAWRLWVSQNSAARGWLLMVVLAIVLRLILFSSMENPEPRYLVEFFPLLSILGGTAIAHLPKIVKQPQMDTDKHR